VGNIPESLLYNVYREELQRDTDEPFTGFSPDLKEVYYRLKFKSLSERI
jgi:hypothetical protein